MSTEQHELRRREIKGPSHRSTKRLPQLRHIFEMFMVQALFLKEGRRMRHAAGVSLRTLSAYLVF